MPAQPQLNTYINNHYQGMSPEQLILMLFKGALEKINLVQEGIEEGNIPKRGENLSKVIDIISTLNASLNPNMTDEGTEFLRGLYGAMLTELPKVSTTNDPAILKRIHAYISRLKEIWETDVMKKGKAAVNPYVMPTKPKAPQNAQALKGFAPQQPQASGFRSICA